MAQVYNCAKDEVGLLLWTSRRRDSTNTTAAQVCVYITLTVRAVLDKRYYKYHN